VYVSPEKDTIDITNENLEEIYKRIEKDRKKQQEQNSKKQPKRSSIPWIITLTIIAFFFTSNTLKR
jgi:reverse gyrase